MTDAISILLAEDEPLIHELLVTALTDEGFEVVAVDNGQAAIDAINEEGQTFSVVVTDVLMKGAVTGWEVAKAARSINANVGIIYATGHGENDWSVEGVPGSVLIPKPFVPTQLTTAIANLLNKTAPSA